jgi:hypothetical protein
MPWMAGVQITQERLSAALRAISPAFTESG